MGIITCVANLSFSFRGNLYLQSYVLFSCNGRLSHLQATFAIDIPVRDGIGLPSLHAPEGSPNPVNMRQSRRSRHGSDEPFEHKTHLGTRLTEGSRQAELELSLQGTTGNPASQFLSSGSAFGVRTSWYIQFWGSIHQSGDFVKITYDSPMEASSRISRMISSSCGTACRSRLRL